MSLRYYLKVYAFFVVVLVAVKFVTPFLGVVDDAWITYRYAHNLAAGQGISFNPGERVEGCTAFLLAPRLVFRSASSAPTLARHLAITSRFKRPEIVEADGYRFPSGVLYHRPSEVVKAGSSNFSPGIVTCSNILAFSPESRFAPFAIVISFFNRSQNVVVEVTGRTMKPQDYRISNIHSKKGHLIIRIFE